MYGFFFTDCFSHSTHTLLFRGSGSTDDSRVKETKNGSNFSEGRVLRNTPLPNKNLTSTTQKTPVAVYHKHTGNIDPIQQSWQRYKELSVQFVLGSRNKNFFSRSQENICFKKYLNLLVKGRSKKQRLQNLCFCQVVSG